MNRWENLKRLLRMEGSVAELIGTGVFIGGGFVIGLTIGRFFLNIF